MHNVSPIILTIICLIEITINFSIKKSLCKKKHAKKEKDFIGSKDKTIKHKKNSLKK